MADVPGQPSPRAFGRIVAKGAPRVSAHASGARIKGQEPGEEVIWIRRRSLLFFAPGGVPLLLAWLGLLAVHLAFASRFALGAAATLALGVALLAVTLYWASRRVYPWLETRYILTNQRVISEHGLFTHRREEIPLRTIAQVLIERNNPLILALGIGDVMVRPIGTPLVLRGVADPREIADSILATQENPPKPKQDGEPERKPLAHKNAVVQAALETLAKPTPAPIPPTPRAPRSFGLFQRPIPIRFLEGESVVELVYRHWFVYVRNAAGALLVLAVSVGVAIAIGALRLAQPAPTQTLLLVPLLGAAVGLAWAYLVYLNYADDVFVLTTHRVIDIDRLFFILSEYSNDAPYGRIQDIHAETSALGRLLGYGTIVVETSGRRYPITMSGVPDPFGLLNRIFAQMNAVREREAVAAQNKQRKENARWVETAFDALLVETPELRGLSLLEASARARAAGLRLVVEGERADGSARPGVILEQAPSAGSVALSGGEARVTLSASRRRAA